MNPPSALQSAMNRERKPFTYLPGGLDLSEIKSQRMAKRLMRNAMNPGVSELPSQPAHAQTTPTTTIPVPNFNCLPVQVFPAFQLPANPKSLLRTRSTPDPKMPSFLNPKSNAVNAKLEVNKPMFPSPQVNNGSLNSTKPEVCYENNSKPLQVHNNNPFEDVGCGVLPKMEYVTEYHHAKPLRELNNIVLPSSYLNNKGADDKDTKAPLETTTLDTQPSSLLLTLDDDASNNDQKEIKTSKEEISKQNGDAEAAVTVKLPAKKSEAQTETKVDVVKKTLPDGSLQEITTTTTTTTVDGRTEIKTRTQTKTFPKEVVEEEEVEESEEEVEEDNKNDEDENKNNDENKNSIITNEERSESTTTKKVTIVQNTTEGEVSEKSVEPEKESNNNDESVEIKEVEEINEENDNGKDDEQGKTEVKKSQVENTEIEDVKKEHIDSEEEYEEAEEVENIKNSTTEQESAQPLLQNEDQDESEYTEEEYESEVEEENKIEETVSKKSESTQEENEFETESTVETNEDDDKKIESDVEVEKPEEATENSQVEETSAKELRETVKEDVKSETNEVPAPEENAKKSEVSDTSDKGADQSSQETENIPKEEHEIKLEVQQESQEEKLTRPQPRVQFREPSVPLEKVEDLEIKPITGQDFVSKSTVEKTEIITRSNEQPKGILSKQTEYNRVENIVTVNRSTKTLDRQLDDYVQPSYLMNNVTASPQVKAPYQPSYIPDPTTERRHSLLLERLSVDRQLPITEIYTHPYSSQASEQKQWSEEPQSEVLAINNVKPSMITKNQQWYQNTSSNISQNEQSSTYQPWNQQQQPIQSLYQPPQPLHRPAQPLYQPAQPQYVAPQSQYVPPQPQYQAPQPEYSPPEPFYQSQYQPKPQQYQPQPQHSPQPQTHYQSQPTYQTQSQYKTQSQPQYKAPTSFKPQSTIQPEQHYQSSYSESHSQETKSSSTFKPNVQLNSYPNFTPKPDWNTSSQTYEQTNQFSEKTDYHTPDSYGPSYVPPPWEQDSKYVVDSSLNNYEPSPISGLSPTSNQSWMPTSKSSTPKYNKTTPKAYIPPAPNQSFVKPVTATQPKVAGRKTYYSEYERRYISVPESTYIPNETKFQHQPDPSPVYYYNTEESSEPAEPEWRKELREFTEKTTKTEKHTETSVRPPWDSDKQVKSPAYTPTPTWSQTLQPRSHRERSFEAERYTGGQEWPKTNTVGRGRPLSTYEKSDYESPVQRVRGVSVDRYNPYNYQSPSPAEHPPVQSQTLTAENAPQKHYHNPNVPAYHSSRASAEPRDPASFKQARPPTNPQNAPFQSRSFKYLQWITGTED